MINKIRTELSEVLMGALLKVMPPSKEKDLFVEKLVEFIEEQDDGLKTLRKEQQPPSWGDLLWKEATEGRQEIYADEGEERRPEDKIYSKSKVEILDHVQEMVYDYLGNI